MKNIEYRIIANENSQKVFQCMRCYKNFNLSHGFHQHFRQVHREMKFKCEKCNKPFPSKSKLDKHMEKCDGSIQEKRQQYQKLKDIEYRVIADKDSQKMFQCMRCQKSFNVLQGFHQHFHQVHREKNFQCAQCSKLNCSL